MAQVKSLRTGIKFKDTPIGKIPVDWEVATLESISNDIYRYPTYYNIKYVEQKNGVPEVRGELIKDNGELSDNLSDYRFISKETSSQFPRTILREGDFVISVRGTLGKIGYVSAKLEGANMTANLIRVSPKHDQAFPLWLKQILLSDIFQKKLHGASSATTIKTITAPELKGLNMPLPPLLEQKKIAEILTTVDDAIEETDRIIEKARELKKGLMQKLLTRGIRHKKFKKTEIGEIPVEWEVRSLGDLCEGKPEYGANVSAIDKNNNLPRYVRITDVTDDGYLLNDTWQSIDRRSAEPYILREGDFLFARSGATVGKTYLYRKEDGECAFAGYMIRFRPDSVKLLPEFLFQFTHSDFYYNWVKGMLRAGAQPNINGTEYAGLIIPKPPIDEQRKIVSILSALDKEIKNETDHRRNMETFKKSLMQVLLTGKVRVKLY